MQVWCFDNTLFLYTLHDESNPVPKPNKNGTSDVFSFLYDTPLSFLVVLLNSQIQSNWTLQGQYPRSLRFACLIAQELNTLHLSYQPSIFASDWAPRQSLVIGRSTKKWNLKFDCEVVPWNLTHIVEFDEYLKSLHSRTHKRWSKVP